MSGKRWAGEAHVVEMQKYPYWIPPAEVKRDKPELPNLIPPGPRNPMGSRVMVLNRGQYAIHGTNKPESIGTFASYGCIRMHNHHIEDLYERVRPGTRVVVLQ
jgi:lipoprotein-anchoring transpeptidase ErfK/SrfK